MALHNCWVDAAWFYPLLSLEAASSDAAASVGPGIQTTLNGEAVDELILSRLVSATTPESGTTTYSYSGCSGDPSNVCSRTDARSVTTTYAYDALNRLTSKSYSDGTPTANFWYDYNAAGFGNWWVYNLTNTKGRLFATCTSNAPAACPAGYTGTVYSYDSMGRIINYWQATPYNEGSSAWQTTYSYDLAGDVTSYTQPASPGITITNTIDTAQHVTQIQSSLADSTHPQYLAKSITYTPWGAESTLENGCASASGQEQGCTDTLETYAYNNRLQPVMIELGNSSNLSADYCLVYNYYPNQANPTSCSTPGQSGGYNGGNVVGYYYQDNVNSSLSHTASYGYDALNRLTSAVATGNSTYNLTFSYDRYGNMTCTQNQQTQGLCPQYSFNPANNQITNSGFTYDAAGDLTGDGTNTYQYDAEQHAISVNGGSAVGFTYNALGLRVQSRWPSGTGDFLYDPNGTWQGVANDMSEVYLGSRLVAVPDRFGEALFPHVNLLDSITMETYYNGAVGTDATISPWGNWWQTAGLLDFQFAGTIWTDTTASVDYASYRLYRYDLGRWLSPDPLGGQISNPQSLNRYSYALNNPTTNIDPSGLDCQGATTAPPWNGTLLPGSVQATSSAPCPPDLSGLMSLINGLYGDDVAEATAWMGNYTTAAPPFINFYGGGGAPPPAPPSGPLPSYWQVAKNFNNCAANFADKYSAASLASKFFHVQDNFVLNAALGSTTAAVSNLFFQSNPSVYVPAGASLAAGARVGTGLKVGATVVGGLEVNPGYQSIFSTIRPTTLAETAAGSTALNGVKGLAGLLDLAAPAFIGYDELLYGIGEGVCAAPAF